VQTSHARAKIRAFFRRLNFDENVKVGRALLDRELGRQGGGHSLPDERLIEVAKGMNYQSLEAMLAHIGSRDLSPQTVILRLRSMETAEWYRSLGDLSLVRRRHPLAPGEYEIRAAGIQGVAFSLAGCCNPLPGDPIMGYVTRGRGLTVHRLDCHNLRNLAAKDGSRVLQCEWIVPAGTTYPARLEVIVEDRVGMLSDMTVVVSSMGLNISEIATTSHQGSKRVLHMTVEVSSSAQLSTLIVRMEAIRDVVSVRRVPNR
jgi:GTP pyrophosphokinase